MGLKVFQVDAFTDQPFAGNPAGVVPEAGGLSRIERQKIANEMNLAETAFIEQLDDHYFDVKFFTPIEEVDLCGHATIASFYILASKGYIKPLEKGVKKVIQRTKIGELSVYITYENSLPSMVYMEQAAPQRFGNVINLEQLLDAFSLQKEEIGINGHEIGPEIVSTGLRDILIPVKSEAILDRLKMNKDALMAVSKENKVIGAHIYTVKEHTHNVIKARNFAPIVGVDEEPATGTSNGALIYLLADEQIITDNKILVHQGESLGRESLIYCEIKDQAILVGGTAKISLEGILSIESK
ncbi:MAG TPA: PhzF family phenazine biosynthesis protein [Candidatus Ignatzschineria merdigallinarum]|uniref:PhzF family phenazine biosynthesis protein n=1 Tax=Candidatus Ignatzschineria merdigallinarum TaxID=2838621 RepID=A0A9D1TTU1_9GAMM|nr:PhzF family phenazine biosynthesis protein [Candidatus Ignatzschineria merdigallinarum]